MIFHSLCICANKLIQLYTQDLYQLSGNVLVTESRQRTVTESGQLQHNLGTEILEAIQQTAKGRTLRPFLYNRNVGVYLMP